MRGRDSPAAATGSIKLDISPIKRIVSRNPRVIGGVHSFIQGDHMKLHLKFTTVIMLIAAASVFVACDDGGETPEKTYNLRDTGPAGGLIFYINPDAATDGWKYLEAWTEDESGPCKWRDSEAPNPGTSSAIGAGYTNTHTCMAGSDHPAAEIVRNAHHGGYSDWFIPSLDELIEMCWVLHSRRWNGGGPEDNPAYGADRIGGFAEGSHYWSSCEYNSLYAYSLTFSDGYPYNSNRPKYGPERVRAIRAF